MFAREERLIAEHLCKNTADTPHVDTLVVALRRQHYLRRAVPPRSVQKLIIINILFKLKLISKF